MKTHLTSLALAVLLISSLASAASNRESGGGKGVVCREANGKIKSVELLDLWEAKALYKRAPRLSTTAIRTQVMTVLSGVGQAMNPTGDERHPGDYGSWGETAQRNLEATANMFLKTSPWVNRLKGVSLTLTDDSYEIAKPENCEVEQIVDYVDGPNLIYVNQDLYERMNKTNQAALIVHEAIYRELRNASPEADSLRTRRAVGYLFSGQKLPVSPVPESFLECFSDRSQPMTTIDIYQDKDKKTFSSVELFNEGQEVLGFFPGAVSITTMSPPGVVYENVDSYFSQSVCASLKPDDFLMVWLRAKNPITFDSGDTALGIMCPAGKIEVHLIPKRTAGSGIPDVTKGPLLTCKPRTEANSTKPN